MHCTSACRLFSPENSWPRGQKDGLRKGKTGCSKQEGRLEHEKAGEKLMELSKILYFREMHGDGHHGTPKGLYW